ncbi:hypothetical protein BCR42DRAFT_425045 [Absidia repens]|uniref:Inhibitor of apoptosis-promoting Bax1-domain-containing protein n=1 Tax=Absidia repens TaxID=90262 RepID=A0A1X2I3B0_9FUNG|nr:hypothetical protein BCR42DRAFT_425045 [Absidia repens]
MIENTPILPTNSPYLGDPLLTRYHSSQLDLDVFGTSVTRNTIPVQMSFSRNVLLILFGQVLTTLVFTVSLQYIQLTWDWLQISILTWWIPIIPCVLAAILILWQLWALYFQLVNLARIILLTIFSCLSSFIIGEIVVTFCYADGLLVMNLVISGIVAFYCYTFQQKFKFSGPSPWFCGMAAICLNASWLRILFELDALEILTPIGLAGVICTYILLDLYYIMDNTSAEDVILANTCLYADILYPMRCLHNLCELSDNLNMLDILYPGPPN